MFSSSFVVATSLVPFDEFNGYPRFTGSGTVRTGTGSQTFWFSAITTFMEY